MEDVRGEGMTPKDIKREFLTGPRKFDEIMEKLEIIINEMMADDRQAPMDLGTVGTHDARKMQSDQDASNDMSCDDLMCDRRVKDRKLAMEQARKDQTEQERCTEGK